jgi:hypothetical protein
MKLTFNSVYLNSSLDLWTGDILCVTLVFSGNSIVTMGTFAWKIKKEKASWNPNSRNFIS